MPRCIVCSHRCLYLFPSLVCPLFCSSGVLVNAPSFLSCSHIIILIFMISLSLCIFWWGLDPSRLFGYDPPLPPQSMLMRLPPHQWVYIPRTPCGCGCGWVECVRGCGYPPPPTLWVWVWVPCTHAYGLHTRTRCTAYTRPHSAR